MRAIHRLLALPLAVFACAGCDRLLGHNCDGADHIVIDMDTTAVYVVGETFPLRAHVETAAGRTLPTHPLWTAETPSVLYISGTTARPVRATRSRVTVQACGLSRSIPVVAAAPAG